MADPWKAPDNEDTDASAPPKKLERFAPQSTLSDLVRPSDVAAPEPIVVKERKGPLAGREALTALAAEVAQSTLAPPIGGPDARGPNAPEPTERGQRRPAPSPFGGPGAPDSRPRVLGGSIDGPEAKRRQPAAPSNAPDARARQLGAPSNSPDPKPRQLGAPANSPDAGARQLGAPSNTPDARPRLLAPPRSSAPAASAPAASAPTASAPPQSSAVPAGAPTASAPTASAPAATRKPTPLGAPLSALGPAGPRRPSSAAAAGPGAPAGLASLPAAKQLQSPARPTAAAAPVTPTAAAAAAASTLEQATIALRRRPTTDGPASISAGPPVGRNEPAVAPTAQALRTPVVVEAWTPNEDDILPRQPVRRGRSFRRAGGLRLRGR
jgi:hypothetical protein